MKSILVVGDIILDEYIYCISTRQNPENSDGRIFVIGSKEKKLGGAAGVALICKSLGCNVELLGSVGNTDEIIELLQTNKIQSTILYSNKKQTRKTRFIIDDKILAHRLDEEDVQKEYYFTGYISKNIKLKPDIILLQDYGKGFVTQDIIYFLLNLNIPIIVDPYVNADWNQYRGVSLIKCNLEEGLSKIAKSNSNTARALYEKYKTDVVVTSKSDGMYLATKDINAHFPTKSISVVDSCGAGDTVLATLGVCMANYYNITQSCIIANRVARDQIQSIGINPVKNLKMYLTSDENGV